MPSLRIGVLLIASVLAAPSVGWAGQQTKGKAQTASQQQARKWWLDDQYRSTLGLSPEQVSRIDKLFEEHSAVQRQLWASLQEAEREVSKLMATEAPQEGQVIAAIERTELLRYKINERRAVFLFRIRQQLSLEQHRKLEKLMEWSRSDRGRSERMHESR